ncbi:MAG: [cytidine(C)-cytidine(C)-adenosine (A)]-adding enzyme [Deltaproteobacteria bacterium]
MPEGSDANARLAAAVPANVREVCARIAAAGFQAVTVGGAVRDVLLGKEPGDWDIATSAHPNEVLGLFRHTIPTGLQHGTVTIVTGKGADSHVEVTTYRGEGAYTDARRPDSVVFGVPLAEDLARRDLTVNAIAYDVAADALFDPYGGVADLEAKRLRAVGVAVDRFTEDGLRVMRAVRFAAQLEFELDPDTEAGIAPALPSLAKVSRERVSDELRKILGARQPSRGLVLAERTGILATIAPDLTFDLVAPDRVAQEVRLAALVVPIADRKRIGDVLKALKFSNAEADLAAALGGAVQAVRGASDDSTLRRVLSSLGRPYANAMAKLEPRVERVLRDPLVLKELAVSGSDLATYASGRALGDLLAKLLDRVLSDPKLNTRDQLLAIAGELAVAS